MAEKKSKTEVVKEIIAGGVTAPKEIAEIAKEKYKLVLKPQYVSVIKSNLNKGTKKAAKKASTKVTTADVRKAVSSGPAKGSTETRLKAAQFALSVGGIDAARKLLDSLETPF